VVPDMVVPHKTVATRLIPHNSSNSNTRLKAQVPHTTATHPLRSNMEMPLALVVRKARKVSARLSWVAPRVASPATSLEVDSWAAPLERPLALLV
jgi:hypothetical protein